MSFQPVSGVIRTGTPSPATKPAASQVPEAAPEAYVRRGRFVNWSLADQEREAEAEWPRKFARDLPVLRGAKRVAEMRTAIEAARETQRLLRERIEKLSAERRDLLRRGYPAAAAAGDEKLAGFKNLEEGYALLITDFEGDLPAVEQREAEEMAALRARFAALTGERQAVADRVLAKRALLEELAEDAGKYHALTAQIDGERVRLRLAGIAEADLNVDLSAPLVPSPYRGHSMSEMHRPVMGDIGSGLRIPGIAPRGEVAPEWIYLGRP